MHIALKALNALIAQGAEFPEALYLVSTAHRVDHQELTDAYDAQFA